MAPAESSIATDAGRDLRGIITLQAGGIDGRGGEIIGSAVDQMEMDTVLLVPAATTLVYVALATP